MARNETATELRRLRQLIDRQNRRLAMMELPGKVKASETDTEKRTVRLVLGTSKDGTEILSPPIRWQESSAGRLKIHSEPDDQEQMIMRSLSGTVGLSSIAVPGTYDKDHDAPSKETDISVLDRGDGARIELGAGKIKFIGVHEFVGPVSIDGDVATQGALTNNGVNVSSTHVHGGVSVGGADTAEPH